MRRADAVMSLLVVCMIISYAAINFGILEAAITGLPIMSTRLVIITETQVVCNTTYGPGWNLVSFPCLTEDAPRDVFFMNLEYTNQSYRSIRHYTAQDASDPWKSYNPNLPSWVEQDIDLISRRQGYWMYFDNTTNIFINNTLGTPTLMQLYEGWNMIGYPSQEARPINDTFDQVIPDYDYVLYYNTSNGTGYWDEYTWNSSLVSNQYLNKTSPYSGYWIYVLDDTEMVIE